VTTVSATDFATRPGAAERRVLDVFTPAGALVAGLLTLGFGMLFFRWFYVQHQISMDSPDDWGHAYFVPLISAYLVWTRRDELARTPVAAFWPALAPFLLGIMAYFFCVTGVKNHMLQGFSMILCLFGLVLLMLGPGAMRVLFLPIAFLGFGVTISEAIMIELTFQLQIIASYGAWMLLSVVGEVAGFGCEVSTNVLRLVDSHGGIHPLNVAEACSGMRMVVAFCALAAATALLGCRHWWQRVAVMLLAVPIAVLINVGRVAVLGLLSLADSHLSEGSAHTLIGTLLLVPGLGLFMLVVWSLNRVVREGSPA
jgi:exosortase